jgi:hypothetical protein
MNTIKKIALEQLGYRFIEPQFLPEGQDEYYLRNLQNRNGILYRKLSAYEIEVLVRNRNTSDDWNNILVSDAFNPELVKNCKFYGLVRIGKLEPYFLEFSQLRVPVGLYNSTIISCDFGDNVVVDNVNYISHYIIGSEAIIVNVNELMTTPHAKFGNGIVKEGEPESVRIWMELCNENAGRSVIPFNGMLPGDAWLWSKYRDHDLMLEKFKEFTQQQFDTKRGYYGKIGDRTVIKNCAIIKDVWVGSDAYLKGANKLKNLTINSDMASPTQIGEGCELVNGIVGFGCRIFYGVKAVRFILSSHSQLKYGARLINSFLGHNSTISCCEVLNSLIFPSHEQHHNNSFLCAALIMGQSNMAAGATIGSNHNSRSADGELVAGRGFWPGLCVSLKHNSKFASFTIIAKGDYPAELSIPLPFSLVSQDLSNNELQVVPGYWFMYNMYALARNAWKYVDRDKRIEKIQSIEVNYLAPDTVQEMLDGMAMLEMLVGKAWYAKERKPATETHARKKGAVLLQSSDPVVQQLDVIAEGFENSKRNARILKAGQAWHQYRSMVLLYGLEALVESVVAAGSLKKAKNKWPAKPAMVSFQNVGGQLMPSSALKKLVSQVEKGKINNWNGVHDFYQEAGKQYGALRTEHALAGLETISGIQISQLSEGEFAHWTQIYLTLRSNICSAIEQSRSKDHSNPFRKMVYETEQEMDKVLGKLSDNEFINMEKKALAQLKRRLKPWVE